MNQPFQGLWVKRMIEIIMI